MDITDFSNYYSIKFNLTDYNAILDITDFSNYYSIKFNLTDYNTPQQTTTHLNRLQHTLTEAPTPNLTACNQYRKIIKIFTKLLFN